MKKVLLKTLWAALASWLVVVPMFFMVSHAGNVLEQAEVDGYEIPVAIQVPLYLSGAIGVVSDAAFNISIGTVIYRELPHEWMFTARSTRHLTSGGWRQEKAEDWCELLHRVDPGHCGGWIPP